MKLSELAYGTGFTELIGEDVQVESVSCDSRVPNPNGVFVCIKGLHTDSHECWQAAQDNGNIALIAEHVIEGCRLPTVVVPDTRAALAVAAAHLYGNPADDLTVVAVTGTNGKTTTTHMIAHVASTYGIKACLIGTSGIYLPSRHLSATLTTPDPIDLQKIFALAREEGCQLVVMEVSAHAIDLKKLAGVRIDIGVFTNLSRDHLDYFKDMQRYGETKKSFFTSKQIKYGIVNVDDEWGRKILKDIVVPYATYGVDNPSDVFAVDYLPTKKGASYIVNVDDKIYDLDSPLRGRYNMMNTLAAVSVCYRLGLTLAEIAQAIAQMPQIAGRCQTIVHDGKTVVIDYAHTPEGVGVVLASMREWAKGRILTVFGCGGNRDTSKRPLMGAAAETHSDEIYVTTDNPRYEEPESIIRAIVKGLKDRDAAHIYVDRKQAIAAAISDAKRGDIVAILGKGNEEYQDVNGVKLSYSDLETVEKLFFGERA